MPDTAVLLYVGRLAREKNVEEIILYQEMIKKRNAVLMIVGDGPFSRELEMLAEKKGLLSSIIFTGMVSSEDIWKYYQTGDLFVSASTGTSTKSASPKYKALSAYARRSISTISCTDSLL